jgi:hypothetical protein
MPLVAKTLRMDFKSGGRAPTCSIPILASNKLLAINVLRVEYDDFQQISFRAVTQ